MYMCARARAFCYFCFRVMFIHFVFIGVQENFCTIVYIQRTALNLLI